MQPGSLTPQKIVETPKPVPDLVTINSDFERFGVRLILWNSIPKRIIMKFPKKTFDGYGNYFERLGGTFYADYDNGSAWLFPANRQKDIEDIVRNIVTYYYHRFILLKIEDNPVYFSFA